VGPGAGLDRCGKSRPTRIRSPDLPAHSELLYRLRYPGSLEHNVVLLNAYSMLNVVLLNAYSMLQWDKVVLSLKWLQVKYLTCQ
jgi:hypothetical protein